MVKATRSMASILSRFAGVSELWASSKRKVLRSPWIRSGSLRMTGKREEGKEKREDGRGQRAKGKGQREMKRRGGTEADSSPA